MITGKAVEEIVTYFKVMFLDMLGRTEKINRKLKLNSDHKQNLR
jgi:hypothetical protein